ncbi:MAG: 4-hydroxy-tetrahydrodipicolinate synthase [Bacteroidales bacterium]|jgi:4-hydroxy-tetrahydrodipicolinate synthase|nr:4-hydroxy-tetrahydrodipicolinate synthase [Bacteroidales bacterium]
MKAEPIKGTGVALVTPFHNYGTIDFTSLGKLVKHVIRGGADFLVAMGTTSEAPVLSKDEKTAVVNHILEVNKNRLPVILGMGGNNTQLIVDSIRSTDFEGISGILSVAPYYNKPNQKGIYYHFKSISAVSPVPVILYNVPGRTCSNISAETCLRLAHDFDNITAIKEASGDFSQIMEILHNRPEGFSVLSGDDAITLPMMALGADGAISVVANAFPKQFSSMVSASARNDYNKARELHFELLELMEALFEDGNPGGIKAALDVLGLAGNNLRLPLVKVNKATYNTIANLTNTLK